MPQKKQRNIRRFCGLAVMAVLLLVGVASLSGCDWFDSDGDNNDPAVNVNTGTGTTSTDTGTGGGGGTAVSIDGTGIIWKPVSEADGKLAVILPPSYGTPGADVYNPNGTLIETGDFSGFHNGDWAVYRYTQQGAGYPSPCHLKVGGTFYLIPVSANRYN